jgi:hypothetical protein
VEVVMLPFNIALGDLLKLRDALKMTRKGSWELEATLPGGNADLWLVTEGGKEPLASFKNRTEAAYAAVAREWLPKIVNALIVDLVLTSDAQKQVTEVTKVAIRNIAGHYYIERVFPKDGRRLFLTAGGGWSEMSNIAYPPREYENNMQATAHAASLGFEEIET